MAHRYARVLQSFPPPTGNSPTETLNFIYWVGENINRLANNTNIGVYHGGGHTTGHIRFLSQAIEGDVVTITVGSVVTSFEFDTDSILSGNNVGVTIGATLAATVTNFVEKIGSSIGLFISAFQHATETGVVDCIAKFDATSISFLENTGGARIALQSNGETQVGQAVYLYTVRRTITAEDLARGRIRFNTSFTSIINYVYNITSSATLGTAVLYAGTIAENGGALEFTASVLAVGNVMRLWAFGLLGDKESTDDTNPGALTNSGDFIPA